MKRAGETGEWLRRGLEIFEGLVERSLADIARVSADPDPVWGHLEKVLREYAGGQGAAVRFADVLKRLAECRVVVVGGLSTSWHGLDLVRRLVDRLPLVSLALSGPSIAHQATLAAFLGGKMDVLDFAREVDLADAIPPHVGRLYLRLLERARRSQAAVTLYESDAHSDIRGRDDDAMTVLDAALSGAGKGPLLVLTGELRASPASLLGGLQRLVGAEHVAAVYCDLPGPYLRDILRGGEGRGWSALGNGRFCECRQSPLASLQTCLAVRVHDEVPVRGDRLAEVVRNLVRRIARFVRAEAPRLPEIRVLGPGDPRTLSVAAASGRLDRDALEFLAGRMAAGESRMIPEANLLYVGNIAAGHVAEEAAHWLRALTGGADYCRYGEDAFWGVAVQELLGYYGSKVVSPGRRPPGVAELPANQENRGEALAHIYGYNLAERLFGLAGEREVTEWVSAAFLQDLVEPGTAKRLYLSGLDLVAGQTRSRKRGRNLSAGGRKGR